MNNNNQILLNSDSEEDNWDIDTDNESESDEMGYVKDMETGDERTFEWFMHKPKTEYICDGKISEKIVSTHSTPATIENKPWIIVQKIKLIVNYKR